MSVYRPKGTRYWRYDFQRGGVRYRGSTEKTNRREALEIEALIKARVLEGKYAKRRDMVLVTACARYMREVTQQQTTSKTTEYIMATVCRGVGDVLLVNIDNDVVAEYVARRRATVSAGTVNRELKVLRAVMNRAKRVWKISTGDVAWRSHFRRESPPRDRVLTADEQDRLLKECAPHIRPMVEFSLLTGLRQANVLGLDWSQIDMQGRSMTFIIKGGKRHRLPMTDDVFILLANMGPRDSGPVFTWKGRSIKTVKRGWKAALRRAGIEDFRWHDLRHTAASRMIARGVDLSLVKTILGHAHIDTTMRYVHHKNEMERDALDRLSHKNPHSRREGKV